MLDWYSRCFLILFPKITHLRYKIALYVVGPLLTADSLEESEQVGDEIERWRHGWINDKSQPDFGSGIEPDVDFLFCNIGHSVVQETNTDVDKDNDDDHLQI